jgi:hypothetical protein
MLVETPRRMLARPSLRGFGAAASMASGMANENV